MGCSVRDLFSSVDYLLGTFVDRTATTRRRGEIDYPLGRGSTIPDLMKLIEKQRKETTLNFRRERSLRNQDAERNLFTTG